MHDAGKLAELSGTPGGGWTPIGRLPGDLDLDHSRAGLAADIVDAWLPLIRPGGWIGGHDHDHPLFPGVAEAVEAAFGGRVELDADRTWFSLP